ncbi:macro domain-containing protein [Candidatus Pacearchaeota archaeon]|nr:macro domain-containing protein [Candidatus Pacearchaeota archaeon]
MIPYRHGDLFSSNTDALAHGCNIVGKMNAGIARGFKERFPEMYEDFQRRCRKGEFQLGTGYIYQNPQKPHVINLATQDGRYSGLGYIETSLEWMSRLQLPNISTIAMPKIGCGLGRQNWEVVEKIIEKYFSESRLNLEIWTPK